MSERKEERGERKEGKIMVKLFAELKNYNQNKVDHSRKVDIRDRKKMEQKRIEVERETKIFKTIYREERYLIILAFSSSTATSSHQYSELPSFFSLGRLIRNVEFKKPERVVEGDNDEKCI